MGHATLMALDASKPASRSPKVVRQLVRERWGHDGVLVTDDLSMGAVVAQGMCGAGVDALNAGIDLLLVSYDPDQYFEVFYCMLQAQRRGQLEAGLLQRSQRRLQKLRQSFPLPPAKQAVVTSVSPQQR